MRASCTLFNMLLKNKSCLLLLLLLSCFGGTRLSLEFLSFFVQHCSIDFFFGELSVRRKRKDQGNSTLIHKHIKRHAFLSKHAMAGFCSCWLVPASNAYSLHLQDFTSNQRTCRQVKTCEDELRPWKCTEMEGRLGHITNKYGEYIIYIFIGLQPSNFRTLSKRAGPGIILVCLSRFNSPYFPKYNNIRIRERLISVAITQNSIPRKRRKERKMTARKSVLFAV